MALIKAIPTAFGVDAGYWKLVETNFDWLNGAAHVVIAGWKDEEARGRFPAVQPIASYVYDWSGDDFPGGVDEKDELRATCYRKIKADDGRFENAVDDLTPAQAEDLSL